MIPRRLRPLPGTTMLRRMINMFNIVPTFEVTFVEPMSDLAETPRTLGELLFQEWDTVGHRPRT